MNIGTRARIVLLVAAGALIGYVAGPPLAGAVSSAVKIEDRDSSTRADVGSSHRLHVDTEATANNGFMNTFALTEPNGESVLVSATNDDSSVPTGSVIGDVVGVSVDVSDPGSAAVTVQLRSGTTAGEGEIIWQGSIPAGIGHLDWTFAQSILFFPGTSAGFNVHVIDPGGATVQYEVYGAGFTGSGAKASRVAAGG